jgi:hypothetical protein
VPWRWRVTTGRPRASRSRRSPSASGAHPRPSRATSTTPDGEKARAVKARHQGVCRGCGAPTQARNGKGDAYEYCKRCHPGAIAREWTRERIREAMRDWCARYGTPPSSYDWSRAHARRRGPDALVRLSEGEWPSASAVTDVFGSWTAAREATLSEIRWKDQT